MRRSQTIIILLTLLFPIGSLSLFAQSEPEYLMEIGGGVGMMAYEGDFNGSIAKGMHPCASLVWRNLFNPRMGWKVAFDYGKIKGSSTNITTAYPDYNTAQYAGGTDYEFSKSLFDLNATYEYNFWPYGTGREYRGAKPLTPYILAGIGFCLATNKSESAFALNVPVGLGVKYKVSPRVNLNVEWSMHFTTTDKLDGIKDPYYVETSGIFKNKDCYSALMVSLTYSFKEKCRVCHNQDE